MRRIRKFFRKIRSQLSHKLPALFANGKQLQIVKQQEEFIRLDKGSRPELTPLDRDRHFCYEDIATNTPFDAHYVYHTAWAMRVLARIAPAEHVDISSFIHFVTHASAFFPVRHLDYRPPLLVLDNLTCGAGDLNRLPFSDNEVKSLSCLSVIEHIGLGRYGDPLDPEGDRKAAAELSRVLAIGGDLLMVVPVGRPRTCFNAHRIYSFAMVKAMFPKLQLHEWALTTDKGTEGLIMNASLAQFDEQKFGCGCFWFKKAADS